MNTRKDTLPIERMIVEDLRVRLNNPKIKVDDLMVWSTSEILLDKAILENEIKIQSCGVFVAINERLDKSKKE